MTFIFTDEDGRLEFILGLLSFPVNSAAFGTILDYVVVRKPNFLIKIRTIRIVPFDADRFSFSLFGFVSGLREDSQVLWWFGQLKVIYIVDFLSVVNSS